MNKHLLDHITFLQRELERKNSDIDTLRSTLKRDLDESKTTDTGTSKTCQGMIDFVTHLLDTKQLVFGEHFKIPLAVFVEQYNKWVGEADRGYRTLDTNNSTINTRLWRSYVKPPLLNSVPEGLRNTITYQKGMYIYKDEKLRGNWIIGLDVVTQESI